MKKVTILTVAQILQMNDVQFLGEPDVEFTTNVTIVLESWWDVPLVLYQLNKVLMKSELDKRVSCFELMRDGRGL